MKGKTNHKSKYRNSYQSFPFILKTDYKETKFQLKWWDRLSVKTFHVEQLALLWWQVVWRK